ncbi:IclR family transcriptional regulator domain-containing protein [Abyssogena phaseoliformis symbiont]|uniref:IclR family transcriptional regulator domain-containing protein n=1 Tax=Abyssogena phaseoliformis symbiont TaxID=596095 RepID=UPI001CED511B|nr:IclR family transcriptional regulator C-terminal domain-containing protein [Abyssogena phaseoliformis symbiont]
MAYGQRKNNPNGFFKNIRDKGYYVSVNEHNISLFAISIPVIADNGHFVGALTVSRPISRFSDIRQKELLSLLTKYVRNIHMP